MLLHVSSIVRPHGTTSYDFSVNMYAIDVLILLLLLLCLFLLLLLLFVLILLLLLSLLLVLGSLCAFYSFGSLEGAAMLVRALPMRSRKRLPLPTISNVGYAGATHAARFCGVQTLMCISSRTMNVDSFQGASSLLFPAKRMASEHSTSNGMRVNVQTFATAINAISFNLGVMVSSLQLYPIM